MDVFYCLFSLFLSISMQYNFFGKSRHLDAFLIANSQRMNQNRIIKTKKEKEESTPINLLDIEKKR